MGLPQLKGKLTHVCVTFYNQRQGMGRDSNIRCPVQSYGIERTPFHNAH